jgi:hypothetical protein
MAMATAELTIIDGRHTRRAKTVGRVFGWFFLATFITSIPAYFSPGTLVACDLASAQGGIGR